MNILKTVVIVFGLLLTACGQVDPGERAIFVRWGTMDQACYGQGLYWYEPFGTNMDLISVREQAFTRQKMAAATRDLQEIHADVVVNFSLDGQNCHRMFDQGQSGHQYKEVILAPALDDALKAGTAHFAIDEIIQNREKLRIEVTKSLQARVAKYYIIVPDNGVKLVNFEPSKEYLKSVEAKQIQQQAALQEAYKVEQTKRQAESRAAAAKGEADAVREAARGQADATRAEAQARADALKLEAAAQADYNAKVSASLTPILIQNRAIDAWRAGGAQVPQVSGAGGLLLQIPMPQSSKPKE